MACKPQKRSWLFGTGFCHVDTRYLARREIKVERPDRRRNDVRNPLLLRTADTYGYMGNLQLEFPPELCWPISAGVGYVGVDSLFAYARRRLGLNEPGDKANADPQ